MTMAASWTAREACRREGWDLSRVAVLGSDPAYLDQYRRLFNDPSGVERILVEDVATAVLLSRPFPDPGGAAAAVFGEARHPSIARYERLAAQLAGDWRLVRNALSSSPVVGLDAVTAAALRLNGVALTARPVAGPKLRRPRQTVVPTQGRRGVAVFGATVPWRARTARHALAAAAAATGAKAKARLHVDADFGEPPPSDWATYRPLGVGEPLALAIFLDGGRFRDLADRAAELLAEGVRVFTSGMGHYAYIGADRLIPDRPEALFDLIRQIACATLSATE